MNKSQTWEKLMAGVLLLSCGAFCGTMPAMANPATTQSPQAPIEQVSGTVLDSNGEPLIGASVMVKGSSIGTATDMDGNFNLKAAPGATLVISYVGYETKEVKASATPLTVRLNDNESMLNEVVVVGYGVQKKSDITGSVTSVSKDRLSKLPVSNVLQAMQGATSWLLYPSDAADEL